MITETKDLFQVLFWLVASLGGITTAIIGIVQMWLNRRQRRNELRWKQVSQSKLLLDEIWNSHKSYDALCMLDWSGKNYKTNYGDERISLEDVNKGLRTINLNFSPKEGFIRESFDELFEKLGFLEHYIASGLIQFEDVYAPLEYYMKLINNPMVGYLQFYNYNNTIKFIERFLKGSIT